MNNEEKILAMLESMSKEINGINSRLDSMEKRMDSLEAGQKQIREDIASLSLTVGDMMDDKLSALAHELKWTKDATAQNSMDIAALMRRSK